ncbi:MAG: response regulator [Actinomycetota bacterium]
MAVTPLALVVEDTPDHAALVRRYLQRAGFDVFVAPDAESAIAAFDDIDPRIAILDLLLPGMSGQECAQHVRERFPECFLVISSVLDPANYPPADAALPKPVIGAHLHEIVGRVAL